MVNIFSFFTGKKKSKRSGSWTDGPTASTTAQLVGTSNATQTPAQQSVKRQTSRFLSLRTRSSSKMIDSPKALHRQSSIGSLRRKASRRSSIATVLPKFGFEGESGGKESLGEELGVSGSSLGLANLVGLPKLRDSEVDLIYAVELSVDEVTACWDLFEKALRATGCDTVGLMLPQHTDPNPSTVHQLLALFLLHHQPSIAPSFPSISAYAASQTPKPLYSDLLRNALNDRPHPHELCEILKSSLQHLTPSQTPLIDEGEYIKFVQAEHAATYPLDAYTDLYLPRLGPGIGECLNSIFEVIADIAIKSEDNMMSGGKVCLLLGWWLCGNRKLEGDWQKVYKEWQVAGQRVEHLFYAWIRSQSTNSKLPTRLMELVEDYPFGESTLSTDHLPLPPPSSFPRHTLHIHLESESKFSQIGPRDLLEAALRANQGLTPLLDKLHLLASEGEGMNIDHIIQLESQAFLQRTLGPSSRPTISSSKSTSSTNRLNLPASTSGRSVDSMAHSQLTPLLELSEELGTLASRHPASRSFQRSTSSSSTSAPKADWDDFSKVGFGDAPETATKLDLKLSPRVSPLSLSRSPSAVDPIVSDRPSLRLMATREERIEIIDAFLPFVEDSQLDKTNSVFNNILLVRLSTTAALELSEESPIEWLLLSVTYKPPTPHKPLPTTNFRSSSPSKESTNTRKRFSLGGLTSTFRRSSSMALKSDDLKRSTDSKKSGRGSLEPLDETGGGASEALRAGAKGESLKESGGVAVMASPKSPQIEEQNALVPDSAVNNNTTPETKTIQAPIGTEVQAAQIPVTSSLIAEAEPLRLAPPAETTTAVAPNQTTRSDAQPMGTAGGTSDIADWHYIAEGGANLVFGYHGRNPEYRNKALRIPKSLESKPDEDISDISILWRDELLPKLLPKTHLPVVEPVSLDGKWVAELVEHVKHTRPDFRADIDLPTFSTSATPVKATLMDDLRTSLSDVSHTVLAIEIKPKWGFLPSSENIHPQEAAAIKSEHSRFILHQHMRGVETEYDPLDLYSDDLSRMATAMQALWGLWSSSGGDSNNWRVFVDGQAIGVHEGYMVPGVGESDDEATKTIPILSPVLWHSGVMQRLRDLQSTLDGTDISHIAQRFTNDLPESDLFDPTLLPQPSAEELRQFIDLYFSDPYAGRSDKWSLRESLVAYALSATFKDCSVFITCPLVSTSDGWKLDEPQATVKVIDLDLKPLTNMRKWYDLDEKIWRHWRSTKSVVPEASAQPVSQLATPAEITRIAVPSRLASPSTEALYMPSPDRQQNNLMGNPGHSPHFQSVLASSGQDTSSTRALHTRTPEDSQPSTPNKAIPTIASETPASMSLSDALFISPAATTPASMSLSDALFISPSAAVIGPEITEHATPASMSFSDALFISPSAAMTIANENGRRGSNFGLEESPMKDLNLHGHDEGLDEQEENVGGLKPETPQRMTRSAGPSPSPGVVAAAGHIATGNVQVTAGADYTFPPRVKLGETTHPETQTAITNRNDENTTLDALTPPDPPDLDSSPPTIPNEVPPPPSEDDQQHFRSVIAGVIDEPIEPGTETPVPEGREQDIADQAIFDQEVTEEDTTKSEQLPSVPSAKEQQYFRSIIAGITEEPIKSEAMTIDQGSTGLESETAERHVIDSGPEVTTEDPVNVPAVKQQISTSEVAQNDENEDGDKSESNLAEDQSFTPLANRQQHVRAILAGVLIDDTTGLQSTEMDATVPSADSGAPSITPPFVTPMTFNEDLEPTYPEANDAGHLHRPHN